MLPLLLLQKWKLIFQREIFYRILKYIFKQKLDNMELNKECVVCGGKIEHPRRGKLYCSENCRSRAYLNRKKNGELNPADQKPAGIIEYTFDQNEYEAVKNSYGHSFNLTFIAYCFLRKNLINDPGIDVIHKYVDEFDWDELMNDRGSEMHKKFTEFQKLFFDTPLRVKVIPLENKENKPTEE
jgi:hypothetical protein